MRKSLFATVTVAGALAAAVISPAVSNAVPTTVTFAVTGSTLTLSADATQNLTVSGSTATGAIAASVSDLRKVIGTWKVAVTSTDFTNPAGAAATIDPSKINYTPSVATFTGIPVIVPTPAIGLSSTTAKDVQTATVVGGNTAAWSGTVAVNLPDNTTVGTYTGTITHSLV